MEIFKEISKEIYDTLGSGHTESIYQHAFETELRIRCIDYESQKVVPITYKCFNIGYGFADIVVGDAVIELKAISKLRPQDKTQVINYMEMLNIKKGYLVNFGSSNGDEFIEVYL